MHNILNDIDVDEIKSISLEEEYKKALNNPEFSAIVKSLKLNDEKIMNYTSIIEECSNEYRNCKNCKSLLDCKNRIEGYCYLPINLNGNISFTFKPCKYKKNIEKKNQYLKNIKYYDMPENIKNASLDKIYKTDKKRFEVIKWLMDFIDDYESNKATKGLYLHGNFGCGKTYLISAAFNELAKEGYTSCVIFWPDFLRKAFNDDFSDEFEYVKKVPLLLIDDIGAEGLTAWNRDEILCPLLQYRMDNNLVTFFTSNLNMKELEIHLSNSKNSVDEVKAKRIICRIEQLSNDIEMISKNLRK